MVCVYVYKYIYKILLAFSLARSPSTYIPLTLFIPFTQLCVCQRIRHFCFFAEACATTSDTVTTIFYLSLNLSLSSLCSQNPRLLHQGPQGSRTEFQVRRLSCSWYPRRRQCRRHSVGCGQHLGFSHAHRPSQTHDRTCQQLRRRGF